MNTEDLTAHFPHAVTVGLVSDTHGYLDPRVADIVEQCDIAVHLGDIGSQRVLDELTPRYGFIFAVAGNNDIPSKWDATDTASLTAMPAKRLLKLPGGVLAMEHGHQVRDTRRYHELLRETHPHARAIAYGHTHIRAIDQHESPWVVNPGAAGRERTKGGPSLLTLTAKTDGWRVDEYVFEPATARK